MYELLEKAQEATVVALADLAESRDADTGGHVKRVCLLSDAIATRLFAGGKLLDEITPKFLTQIGLASMLHDVGKVATCSSVKSPIMASQADSRWPRVTSWPAYWAM